MSERGTRQRIDQEAADRIRQLERQLTAAEATIESLLASHVDAVVEPGSASPRLLHQAQEALLQSEKKLRAIFETALEAMVIADDDGVYLNANPAAGELFGVPHEQIVGRSVSEFLAPEVEFEQAWRRFRQSGNDQGLIALRQPDGSIRYAEYSAVAGFLLGQNLSVMRDVTERLEVEREREVALGQLHQAVEALRRSEMRYRTLFETMAEGVIYQDAEGNLIDINPSAERLLGIEPGQASTVAIHNDDLKLVREDGSPFPPEERPGRVAIRSGTAVYGQVMGLYLPQEDSYRWMVVNSIPRFRPGEEAPYQVYSTLTDITERKRTEERRAQLAALVESSQDAIIGVDFEGTITSWNRGAEQVFGYTNGEAIGRHFSILSPPEYRHEQEAVVEKVRRGEIVENYSTVRLTKGGQRIFVSFSISPIFDSTGKTVGLAGIARDITEQKRAEARLRFQAQLLDSVDESVVACDMQERILYWGNGAAALYGYTREEALDRTLTDLNLISNSLSPAERQQQIRNVFEGGSWRGDMLQTRKDGSQFWARITLSLVQDREGKPVGYIGIDRDVTAERQHKRELEVIAAVADVLRTVETPAAISAAIYEQIKSYLELEGGAVAILEPDGNHYRLAYVHGAFEQYQSQVVALDVEVTGKVIRDGQPFVSDDVGAELPGLVPYLPARWAAACVPLIAGNKSLGALWVGRTGPLTSADVRLISSIADMLASVVQRALFFARLEEQAHQVQRIIDTVEDGLLLLDRERCIVLANPSAADHLAALGSLEGEAETVDTLVGRRLEQLGERPLQALLRASGATEQVVVSPGTPRREFQLAAHPVVENGEEGGWVLVLRDVTEARRKEELAQQQERLAAVGQLAAGIAHDFNNVMSAIVLYAQILQRRVDLSDKERRRLDVIYRQANHAIELIKQILDFSRRSVMERSALDVVPFFKETFRLFEHTLPENIDFSLHYEESEYIVLADPTRLQQVITNLAINARDAMPDGGSFTVRLGKLVLQPGEPPPVPEMVPGPWLQVSVSDDGEGMSEAMLQHAFEPFYTTKAPGKGTGLGLAQVYGIVRQHDGFIVVDSVEGLGTTFTIYLPLIDEGKSELEAPVPVFDEAATAAAEATILVVEDEEWARVAIEEALDALGYRVFSAADGQEALEIFAREGMHVDLVLSDMVMPEMGGLKLYERLRAKQPQVKMMIMSGYPLEDGGRALMEQGIVAWISKPFSVNDLADMVAEQLGA